MRDRCIGCSAVLAGDREAFGLCVTCQGKEHAEAREPDEDTDVGDGDERDSLFDLRGGE